MTKKERLEAMIAYYCDGKNGEFAQKLGVKAPTISAWLTRDTYDMELLFAKCDNISAEWLFTGEGEMIIDKQTKETKEYLREIIAEKERYISLLEKTNSLLQEDNDMLKRGIAPQTYVATA